MSYWYSVAVRSRLFGWLEVQADSEEEARKNAKVPGMYRHIDWGYLEPEQESKAYEIVSVEKHRTPEEVEAAWRENEEQAMRRWRTRPKGAGPISDAFFQQLSEWSANPTEDGARRWMLTWMVQKEQMEREFEALYATEKGAALMADGSVGESFCQEGGN